MNFILSLLLLLILAGLPFITLAQEDEKVEETQEEQEVERSIAQEETPYQKDVPMEEETSPQAPHDMDGSQLPQESKK